VRNHQTQSERHIPQATTASKILYNALIPKSVYYYTNTAVVTLLSTSLKCGCSFCLGCTKCSISAIQNSLTRSKPLRGAISLRKPSPICSSRCSHTRRTEIQPASHIQSQHQKCVHRSSCTLNITTDRRLLAASYTLVYSTIASSYIRQTSHVTLFYVTQEQYYCVCKLLCRHMHTLYLSSSKWHFTSIVL
jgi:hypothetical protein